MKAIFLSIFYNVSPDLINAAICIYLYLRKISVREYLEKRLTNFLYDWYNLNCATQICIKTIERLILSLCSFKQFLAFYVLKLDI